MVLHFLASQMFSLVQSLLSMADFVLCQPRDLPSAPVDYRLWGRESGAMIVQAVMAPVLCTSTEALGVHVHLDLSIHFLQ